MSEKSWKRAERMIAERLGGERLPITGRARGSAPDVQAPWCTAEVKTRRRLPLWLTEAVSQAAASAGDDQLPIVVLHQHGERYDDALVIMRLSDFTAWHGEISKPE